MVGNNRRLNSRVLAVVLRISEEFYSETSIVTFSGFRDIRVEVSTFPPVLNRRSDPELVAGMKRYLQVILDSCGKLSC